MSNGVIQALGVVREPEAYVVHNQMAKAIITSEVVYIYQDYITKGFLTNHI